MKRCTKCGVEKDESEFGKQKGGANGLRARCNECYRKENAERYQRNKDKWKAARKAWQMANLDKYREYQRKHFEKDPEHVRAVRRAKFERTKERHYELHKIWATNNPDKILAMNRRWRSENPEKVAKIAARNNLKQALGFTPPDALIEVKAVQYLINRTIKDIAK